MFIDSLIGYCKAAVNPPIYANQPTKLFYSCSLNSCKSRKLIQPYAGKERRFLFAREESHEINQDKKAAQEIADWIFTPNTSVT